MFKEKMHCFVHKKHKILWKTRKFKEKTRNTTFSRNIINFYIIKRNIFLEKQSFIWYDTRFLRENKILRDKTQYLHKKQNIYYKTQQVDQPSLVTDNSHNLMIPFQGGRDMGSCQFSIMKVIPPIPVPKIYATRHTPHRITTT